MHQRHRFGDGNAVLGRASLIEHLHRESVQVAGRDGTSTPLDTQADGEAMSMTSRSRVGQHQSGRARRCVVG